LDQNIAAIIASFIAVTGTLGGAITGVLLSNNHTSKLEQLRIEQEKAKRETAIVEEVYMLLNKIEKQIYDHMKKSEVPEPRDEDMDRVRTLIYLYLPSVKRNFDEFSDSITLLAFSLMTRMQTEEDKNDRYEKSEYFMKSFKELQSSLEKLVR
jgi:hypothetical protein